MKKFLCPFAIISLLLSSCAGDAPETTNSSTDSDTTVTDSLPAGAAFQEFLTYVSGLPKETEMVDSVFVHYDQLKENFSPEEKDSSFFVVKEFMESFSIDDAEIGDLTEERQKELEKEYGKAGFEVWYAEGFPYPMPSIKFLENKFKKDISNELDDYVDLLKKTYKQVTADAGLILEWSELADMIITSEEYLAENPESKYQSEVLSVYRELLMFLMWGLDNTPVIDYWSIEPAKQLDQDVNDVYQKLIKDSKHKTGKIIADHLAWLESKNFEFTYEEVDYLTESEVKMYLGL